MAATFLVVHVFWYCGISRFFVCRLRHQSWYFSRDIASFCLDLVSLLVRARPPPARSYCDTKKQTSSLLLQLTVWKYFVKLNYKNIYS